MCTAPIVNCTHCSAKYPAGWTHKCPIPAPLGSKANPSAHDCLPKLAPDEPYFVIRAKDPLAAAMVELHAYIGAGQSGAAHNKLAAIMALTADNPPRGSDSPKYRETFAISVAMEKWREGKA